MHGRRLIALPRRRDLALGVALALAGVACSSADSSTSATGAASASASSGPSADPSASSATPAWAAPSASAGGSGQPLVLRFDERTVRIGGGEPIPFALEERPMRIDPLLEQLKPLRASPPRIAIDGDRGARGVVAASVLGTVRFAGLGTVRLRTAAGAVDVALAGPGTCPPAGLHEALVLKVYRTPAGETLAWVNGWASEEGFPFVPFPCRPFDRECVRRLVQLPSSAAPAERAREVEATVGGKRAAAVILGFKPNATFGELTDELDAWSAAGAKVLVIDHEMREPPGREDPADCKIEQSDRK